MISFRHLQSIIAKLNADVREVIADPAVREKLIDADLARYGKIIREKGLKAE